MFDLYVSAMFPISVLLNLSIPVRSYKYGPCIGTTRMQRWKRAQSLGLNPPIEVRLLFAFRLRTAGVLEGLFRCSRSFPRRKDMRNKNMYRTYSTASSNPSLPSLSAFLLRSMCKFCHSPTRDVVVQ